MYNVCELIQNTDCVSGGILNPDTEVTEIVSDSRRVTPGCMFICIKGKKKDGHDYICEARRRGASVIVCERGCDCSSGQAKVLITKNARSAHAMILSNAYHRPDRELKIIAVTGTNGKTTVTSMIYNALTRSGKRSALIGTLGAFFEGEIESTGTMTTPDPERLYPLLRRYADLGAEYAVMEASSHALALGKLDGMRVHIGAITNVTPEHLDFHGDMNGYKEAKSKLFSLCEKGVFCVDDAYTEDMYRASVCKKVSCSVRNAKSDYYADNARLLGTDGVEFIVRHGGEGTKVVSEIPGSFTVSNALLAVSVLSESGFSVIAASNGVAHLSGVRGRMEKLPLKTDFSVIIDFAHTPDALSKLLESVRAFRKKGERIVTLFGCGGDRDPSKRSLMGAIASRLSDFVIITSDNSRSENTGAIIDEIMSGFDRDCPFKRIDDRKKAIIYAVRNAMKGDIILLCGKGHEEYEIDMSGARPFSERDIVYSVLSEGESEL